MWSRWYTMLSIAASTIDERNHEGGRHSDRLILAITLTDAAAPRGEICRSLGWIKLSFLPAHGVPSKHCKLCRDADATGSVLLARSPSIGSDSICRGKAGTDFRARDVAINVPKMADWMVALVTALRSTVEIISAMSQPKNAFAQETYQIEDPVAPSSAAGRSRNVSLINNLASTIRADGCKAECKP